MIGGRKWVVLDDDPTGTQTVSGVDVLLRPNRESFRRFLGSAEEPASASASAPAPASASESAAKRGNAVYVLTNTRALPQPEAVAYVKQLKKMMDEEAIRAGCSIGYLLRGDSTLRGHVFAEMEALGGAGAVGLFVPAFPECGRVTAGGIHYLAIGGSLLPVAHTEFARDPVFGYAALTLKEWVAEKGPGWTAATVDLSALRERGAAAVRDALLGASPGTVVIPDAETVDDVRLIAAGLAEAEAAGFTAVVRSASTFAAVRCGLSARELAGVPGGEPERLLVVCGSHTAASTAQLQRLTALTGISPVVVPTDRFFAEGAASVVPALAARLREQLAGGGIAVLATERVREAQHGELADGAKVMNALTETVRAVAPYCDAVVSKGGITSAQTASDGLDADEAEVCGQLEAGISLWRLRLKGGGRMPYAVIPGNVGDEGTMARIVGRMKPSITNR